MNQGAFISRLGSEGITVTELVRVSREVMGKSLTRKTVYQYSQDPSRVKAATGRLIEDVFRVLKDGRETRMARAARVVAR